MLQGLAVAGAQLRARGDDRTGEALAAACDWLTTRL